MASHHKLVVRGMTCTIIAISQPYNDLDPSGGIQTAYSNNEGWLAELSCQKKKTVEINSHKDEPFFSISRPYNDLRTGTYETDRKAPGSDSREREGMEFRVGQKWCSTLCRALFATLLDNSQLYKLWLDALLCFAQGIVCSLKYKGLSN